MCKAHVNVRGYRTPMEIFEFLFEHVWCNFRLKNACLLLCADKALGKHLYILSGEQNPPVPKGEGDEREPRGRGGKCSPPPPTPKETLPRV